MDARQKQVLGIALPIIGGMLSQNLLNLVDTAMVGRLGDNALAGVGMGGFANFLAIAFVTGLSASVQAMASRRAGEGRNTETAIPLNGGLLIAVAISAPLTAIMVGFAPELFALLIEDHAVIDEGVPYLQARLCGMAAVGMNFAFRGYWNGVRMSGLYMRTLIVMHAANIVISYVLIFGAFGAPKLGTMGAGIGTAASTYLGAAMYIILGLRHARGAGFLRGIPDRETMVSMIRLSIPAGLHQVFFAGGMTAFFYVVAQVGTAELAASNVLVNLLLVCILPGIGFGLAGATLVGQALGREDPEEAKRWGFDVAKFAALVVGLIAIPGLLAPELLLKIFITSPETLELARLPLRMVAASMAVDTFGLVLMNAHFGAGDTRTAMVVSTLSQWVFILPAAYIAGPVLGFGIVGIWAAQTIGRCAQSGVFVILWKRGRWAQVSV